MFEQEKLGEYILRVIREKGLTFKGVERMSEGQISDSYIANIINGKNKNLTINKLKALARGLGVEEPQIFIAACGISFPEEGEIQKSIFARLFYKYRYLTEEEKKELDMILEMLGREIERRLINRMPMQIDSDLERTDQRTTSMAESGSPLVTV